MKGEQMQLQYETVLQNTITLLFVLVLSIGQYWILRNVTGRFWSDLEFSTVPFARHMPSLIVAKAPSSPEADRYTDHSPKEPFRIQ